MHTREEVWVQFCASSFIECELGDVVGGNTNSLLSDKRIFQSSECDTESRCSEDGGLSEAEYANGENEPGASNRDSPASGTERCIKRDTCEQKKAVQKHSEHSPPSLLLDKIISMFPKSSQSV